MHYQEEGCSIMAKVWTEGTLNCFCHGGQESMALCPPTGCTNTPESMLFHYCGTQAHLSGRANSWHLTSAYMKATWLWLWINGSPPSLTSPHFHEASTLALLSMKCLCLVLPMLPSARAPVSKLEDTYRLTDLSVVIIFFWQLPWGSPHLMHLTLYLASHPVLLLCHMTRLHVPLHYILSPPWSSPPAW